MFNERLINNHPTIQEFHQHPASNAIQTEAKTDDDVLTKTPKTEELKASNPMVDKIVHELGLFLDELSQIESGLPAVDHHYLTYLRTNGEHDEADEETKLIRKSLCKVFLDRGYTVLSKCGGNQRKPFRRVVLYPRKKRKLDTVTTDTETNRIQKSFKINEIPKNANWFLESPPLRIPLRFAISGKRRGFENSTENSIETTSPETIPTDEAPTVGLTESYTTPTIATSTTVTSTTASTTTTTATTASTSTTFKTSTELTFLSTTSEATVEQLTTPDFTNVYTIWNPYEGFETATKAVNKLNPPSPATPMQKITRAKKYIYSGLTSEGRPYDGKQMHGWTPVADQGRKQIMKMPSSPKAHYRYHTPRPIKKRPSYRDRQRERMAAIKRRRHQLRRLFSLF